MPLKHGYSRASIDHNIRDMRAHHSLRQALGAAYSIARDAWRTRHPGKPLPKNLRPEHESAHHKTLTEQERRAKRRTTTTKKKRAARRNPIKRRTAEERYAGFHGEPPTRIERRNIPELPKKLFEQGIIVAIAYETKRDGETRVYEHTFKRKSAPRLAVSENGRQIVLVDGKYEVTDRGIEDR